LGRNGMTALHYAAANGHTDAVRVLLDHKADIEAKNKGGHDRPALCRGQRSHGRSAGAAGPQGRHRGQEQGRQDSIATGH